MQTWSHAGDGVTTTFPLPGLTSPRHLDYWVSVGGVQQAPTAYSLSTTDETVTFVGPPPNAAEIHILHSASR